MVDQQARLISMILSGLNNELSATPYAHGFLVSVPFFFYDGDRVKLFVESHDVGVRVSDRGLTAMRLTMADVNVDSRRVREAQRRSVGDGDPAVALDDGVLAAEGRSGELADLVFAVGSAAVRMDQLRWLATEKRPVTFRELVIDELVHVVGGKGRVTPHAMLKLDSGRSKQVTASVTGEQVAQSGSPVYVQALNGLDSDSRENAVARCFHMFSLADVPRDQLVAVASGTHNDWPKQLLDEIGKVSTVTFFGEAGSIAGTIDEKLHPSRHGAARGR